MIIPFERRPELQIDRGEPEPIDRCEVLRDVDRSLLVGVIRNGNPVPFAKGQLVTLWADGSIVFQGRAIDEHSVLDLISASGDDELTDAESI